MAGFGCDVSDLLVLGLATNYMLEAWRHGRIFVVLRARWQARSGFVADLLNCSFCLSPYAALLCAAVWYLGAGFLPYPWLIAARLPVLALAVARLANLINDVAHRYCRTPNRESETSDEN